MSANYHITRAVGQSDLMKIRKAHKRYFESQPIELFFSPLFSLLLIVHHTTNFPT